MEWIITYKQDIESAIDTFFSERFQREDVTKEEKRLRETILDAVKSGSPRRLHPMIAMVVYEEVLWLTADTAIPVFIGLEFIRISFSLHGQIAGTTDTDAKTGNTSFLKKYGETMTLLTGDALMTIGLECLAKGSKIDLVQEVLRWIDDSGMIRGMTRDVLVDHMSISEAEYIALHDEETARLMSSAFVVGALFASAAPDILIDQLRRFSVFLCRIHQVKKDIHLYEQSLWHPEIEREKNVVDFLWIEKAKALCENLQFELLKMTQNFQSSKFSDLIDVFSEWKELY
jgi:geranylgeranyl diphosphate synthase, type II